MKIFIEGQRYSREVVKNVLPESRMLFNDDLVTIENVGYFRNPKCDDFVFFLPKVLVDKDGRVFGSLDPNDIIDPEAAKDGKPLLSDDQKGFLYEFAVWIYRALALYHDKNSPTEAVWYQRTETSGGFRRRYVTNTLLDVILALRRFQRENEDYIRFKVKNLHKGVNRINWARTVSRSAAYLTERGPVYLDPVNRKRVVDFDEELLVIFYSILRHVSRKYGFGVRFNLGYELIPEGKFENYLAGYGCTRLHQIKYKYFSDRDLTLWELCYAFFDKAHQAVVESSREEYLLAKNFEIVFESMIDDLIGDSGLERFKDLRDNKRIDHLYVDDSLTRRGGTDKTFYIADSKYYALGNALTQESIGKQFTYARDMLQLNLDLFLMDDDADLEGKGVLEARGVFREKGVGLLRDPVTEGYDVIPNFFISATVDPGLDYDKSGLNRHVDDPSKQEFRNIHFENRFFDRDTLILSHYDVNFLYVIKLYAQNDASEWKKWRVAVRNLFRSHIRKVIDEYFKLEAIMPHEGVDAPTFFRENFKTTIGKVFAPNMMLEGKPVYVMALENHEPFLGYPHISADGREKLKDRIADENAAVRELIDSAFYRVDYKFNDDPRAELKKKATENPMVHAAVSDSQSGVQIVAHVQGPLTKAIDASGWCPCPVGQCPNPEAVRTIVIPFTQNARLYRVKAGEEIRRDIPAADLCKTLGNVFKGVELNATSFHAWRVERIG